MILTWLLVFALFYLIVTSGIFIRNRYELLPLPAGSHEAGEIPLLSVCIPARNEEHTIETIIRSTCTQDDPRFEVLVLDDRSTDNTPDLLQTLGNEYNRKLRVLQGKPLPEGWMGKPWACRQLSREARGELLLFLDADTSLMPGSLQRIRAGLRSESIDMLTVWPEQILKTFWEQAVIPLVYYALVTLLPAGYGRRSPRWIPAPFRKKTNHWFAVACGQCIAVPKKLYEQFGGHNAVRDQVVEDVALAKAARKSGLRIGMFSGIGTVRCRMYRSAVELTEGLRKNFLAGFYGSIPLFLVAGLLHLVVFILPFLALPLSLAITNSSWLFLSSASITLILLQRLMLALWFRWNPLHALSHPLGVLWFQRLGIISLLDRLKGRNVTWKGRPVNR
ncbi:MAG: glycosyltransferase [Balneolaceae bacterium]